MTIDTDPGFWDCKCQDPNYIHPKSLRICPLCKTEPDEQPDSRTNELIDQGFINLKGEVLSNES